MSNPTLKFSPFGHWDAPSARPLAIRWAIKMQKELIRLIEIAGAALEAEDRFFLGAVSANQTAYPDEKGGILRINNERYYQFIVARALASSFPYAAAIEVESHDLVLKYPNSDSNWFAVVEMKRWMSENGEQEIPGILRDIDKLRTSKADNALMLVFSATPKNTTDTQLGWLSKRLGISQNEDCSAWKIYKFPTLNVSGVEVEFWVAGFQVKP